MDFYELKTWQKAKLFDKIMDQFHHEEIYTPVKYDDSFKLEIDVEEYFDKHIFECQWVDTVESEIDGEYYRKINGSRPIVRIDRLIKTKCGKYVGVELKAGGKKLSKALNQIIDYTNSQFYSIRHQEGVFFPENGWMSTFPLSQRFSGTIDSIIIQHRVARFTAYFDLMYGNDVIASPDDEKLKITPPARKVGSR